MVRGSLLGWDEVKPVENCQELFGALRRVRNNLFHGGKSGDVDHDRNDELIENSVHILIEALKCHADVRLRFEGKY